MKTIILSKLNKALFNILCVFIRFAQLESFLKVPREIFLESFSCLENKVLFDIISYNLIKLLPNPKNFHPYQRHVTGPSIRRDLRRHKADRQDVLWG